MARAAASQPMAHVRLFVLCVGAPPAAMVAAVVSYQSRATDERGCSATPAAAADGTVTEAASRTAEPSATRTGRRG
ncbi:hypothetical protein [Streptomyces tricolor]